jgi:hypothetical protein
MGSLLDERAVILLGNAERPLSDLGVAIVDRDTTDPLDGSSIIADWFNPYPQVVPAEFDVNRAGMARGSKEVRIQNFWIRTRLPEEGSDCLSGVGAEAEKDHSSAGATSDAEMEVCGPQDGRDLEKAAVTFGSKRFLCAPRRCHFGILGKSRR